MADVNRGNRPLSPHLTIYKPEWTSMTSILTRITGNALILASILIVVGGSFVLTILTAIIV